MPHATAAGRHADANGTSRSSQPKPTNESNASAATWATTNSEREPAEEPVEVEHPRRTWELPPAARHLVVP